MELLDKNQLKEVVGEDSIWKRNWLVLVSELKYISGIPPFDEILDTPGFKKDVFRLNMNAKPKGLRIELMRGFKYYYIGIRKESIKTIHLYGEDGEENTDILLFITCLDDNNNEHELKFSCKRRSKVVHFFNKFMPNSIVGTHQKNIKNIWA